MTSARRSGAESDGRVADAPSTVAPGRLPPLLWLLLCVAAAFLYSLLNFLPLVLRDFRGAFNREFWLQFTVQIVSWVTWALILPVVLVVVRRLQRARRAWTVAVPVHLVVAVFFVSVHHLVTEAAKGILFPLFISRPPLEPEWASLDFHSFGIHVPEYGIVLAGAIGFEYYRKYLDRDVRASRLEAQLAQAQLQALKAQIHPHFLFNTLHGISALIPVDPEGAELMLGRLSDLLRLTLSSSARQEIPVREEIDALRLYLDIMETRHKGRLSFSTAVDPDAEGALVPSFILQPLVENAIRHGIAPRAEGGTVSIRISRNGEALVVEVEDDGPGFRDDRRTTLAKGLGLGNTVGRLALIYGDGGRLRLGAGSRGGARVEIEIPYRAENEPVSANGRSDR